MSRITTVYISGKITGLDAATVEEKFARAETRFSAPGFRVINPVSLCADIERNACWTEYMKRCIKHLAEADVVYVLPCYVDSRGAQMEIFIAMTLKIKIVYATI